MTDKGEERTWLIFGDSVTNATEKTMHRPIDEKHRKSGFVVGNPNFKLESIKLHETSSLRMDCCRIVQAIKIPNTTLRRMLGSLSRKREQPAVAVLPIGARSGQNMTTHLNRRECIFV